ncbi:hypothetical protein V1503_07800 [Bacillus sp. SCS-151]|uniref:hypothetical protein n=1 Tax=Nanhaiella sioensis TaxID=3115293 RepID=UPI00397AF671
MTRNFDYEEMLYQIEESSKLNGFIMLNLMLNFRKCSIQQLAVGLYLFRFSNVLQIIISEIENSKEVFSEFPQWDYFNLDTVLTPFLIEKYNDRFQKGFIELLSRNLIKVDGEELLINDEVVLGFKEEIRKNKYVYKKCEYISKVINTYPTDILNEKISKIVGDLND